MSTPTRCEFERTGRTTRYEPAGTVPRPTPKSGEPRSTPPTPSPDEAQLFSGGESPRLFGEGSYMTGGSTAEGHYALPDANPRGGYGSFDDAGGYGSTKLLGEHPQPEEPSKNGSES